MSALKTEVEREYPHTSVKFFSDSSVPQYSFASGSVVKNPPANAGDVGLIPGSGRSLGEGNGNPL